MDQYLKAALDEANKGLQEGGIPIGSVIVYKGDVIGRGHNRRVQQGSAVLHGEMDALENAGRQPASIYRECTLDLVPLLHVQWRYIALWHTEGSRR